MALNSDAQGFLIGAPAELGELIEQLRELRREVFAIRKEMRDRGEREADAASVAAPRAAALPESASVPAASVVSPAAAPSVQVGRAESAGDSERIAQPSGRRRAADAAPAQIAMPDLRAAAEPTRPSRRGEPVAARDTGDVSPILRATDDERDDDSRDWRPGSGIASRVTSATAEVAKTVVGEDADASVKAFNEVAEPLKRGWNALRGEGGNPQRRQEGWLRRIFGALKDKAVVGVGAVRMGGAGDVGGNGSRFESAQAHTPAARGESYLLVQGAPPADASRREAGRELSLRAIEGYLKNIDGKVTKPKGENMLLGLMMAVLNALPAIYGFILDRRMDRNLDKIEGWTQRQFEVSEPFFAYARKRLKEMGEGGEGEQKRSGGLFATIVAATLGAAFAKLAGLLSGIPLIGPAIAGLARMLGGTVPVGVGRGGRGSPGVPVPVGTAAKPKWGKTAEGVRGSRPARVARVAMRNAGAVLRRVPVLGPLLGIAAGVLGSRAIERDDTLTRDQKNGKHGRNWGGVGGMVSGALGGAALGTAIAGPVGTVIGGVLGALLGDWLGGNLGQMVGEKFSAFMAPIAAAFGEVRLWALAAFDWVRDGATEFYEGAKGVFNGVGEWISDKWTALADTVGGLFDSFASMLTTVLNGLKNVPVLGSAIRAAEAAARKAAALTAEAARSAAVAAGAVAEGVARAAGKAWDGTKEGLHALIPAGIRDRVAHERALETAADYRAGNIKGLDDAHTRELVASTALTESAGGKLDAVNSAGYVGRYQAGAGWLADAGLIKGGAGAVRAAMQADGFTNEYKWGQSGGMTRFLGSEGNWNNGLSLQKYMASAEVQDAAFKTNSDAAYDQLVRSGAITAESTPEQIAGLLKARHIAGIGGARAVAAGRTGASDANGTSARKYYEDLAGANARFAGAFDRPVQSVAPDMQRMAESRVAPVAASLKAPAPPTPVAAPAVPDAPQVQVPLGSGGDSKPLVVQVQQPDAGQDVRDRGIAHIATGGYAGRQ